MLYKVTNPRHGKSFHPTVFWRTPDWQSSTTQERSNYIKDTILYAGDFDEVNIHLLPRVRRLRLWWSTEVQQLLDDFALLYPAGAKAVMITDRCSKEQISRFRPTIFSFGCDGFQHVRNGEYVSREPQVAVAEETISFIEAMERWRFQVLYTDQYDDIAQRAKSLEIYFDEQT